MNKQSRSILKFITPSFFKGIGSVLNISGNYYPRKIVNGLTNAEANSNAIKSDWEMIGNDFEEALKIIQTTIK